MTKIEINNIAKTNNKKALFQSPKLIQPSRMNIRKKMIIKIKIVQIRHYMTQERAHIIITIKKIILQSFVQNDKTSFSLSNVYIDN